ncbi:3'-5' exoribonuclease 1-like [Lineus longissimus]|uniref:3'-5' exoribonuclease 1-like n=1 Tax=Lineus longissimus TaxID=88925 RepID=UPI002B4EF371
MATASCAGDGLDQLQNGEARELHHENPSKPAVRRDDGSGYAGPYSDPVYKQISLSNGQVNKMTRQEIKEKLASLKLDTRGVKEVLKKRLKNHYKRVNLVKARLRSANRDSDACYDYLAVIDFEATCDENNAHYNHEIIEFPIAIIETKNIKMIADRQEYCRPTINRRLTPFCTQLTGITQSTVDKADTFPDVLKRVEAWMEEHGLTKKSSFAVVTDGPWDMGRFLHAQCLHNKIPFPRWGMKWVNIRKAYRNYYSFRKATLKSMLENLGMTFEGHQHSGIDDTKNIARVVLRMLEDGCDLRVNEKLHAHKLCASQKVLLDVVPIARDDDSDIDSDEQADKLAATEFERRAISDRNSPVGHYNDIIKNTEGDVNDLLYYLKIQET